VRKLSTKICFAENGKRERKTQREVKAIVCGDGFT